jgi:general secretion pathway protein A
VYEEFFGLSDAPFRLTPDPRFLYLSPKHAEALAHLRLGLTEPGGFVCITGDVGTGKTTVLRTFLADLGPEVSTAFIFNPTLSWADLLERIARELGVPAGSTSHVDAMDALNAHLLAQRKEGRISVAVIDEAQAMPLEVLERLRLLSNLETTTEKLLRLVLVGQPQLARLLIDPSLAQLNQRITLRWHLRPLTRRETFTYVRHRLAVAGGAEASRIFTTPALFLVHRYSGGIPRLVNMIAHRATLAAYVKRRHRVGIGSVRSAYREIRNVPLQTTGTARRVGWLTGAVAGAIVVASIGVPRFGTVIDGIRGWRLAAPAAVQDVAAVAAVAPPSPPPPPIEAPVAEPRPAPAPEPRPAVAPAPEPPPAAAAAAAFESRLARLNPERSRQGAVDTLLAAWKVAALHGDERTELDDLEGIAHRRGLEDLRMTGNLSMLRLLDVPAILEVRPPGARESSFVVLSAIGDDEVTLALGTETLRVSPALLDRVWFGDAQVLWRDFEWLGPTFGTESKGPHVARLQKLLGRAGLFGGQATGTFDGPTQAAVIGFQRSRRLDPDGRVGRLTRIALYGAASGYQLPRLATPSTEKGAS